MKKDVLRAIIVEMLILALYCLAVFIIPMTKTPVFWMSFGFTLIAILICAITVYCAFLKNTDAKSRFYGFPIARIGVIYALLQIAVSIIFMLLGSYIPWWIALLVYAFGFVVAMIGLTSVDVVVEQIQLQDVKLKKDLSFMRKLQTQVGTMISRCEDEEVAKVVKSFAEELRYSDPVSNAALEEIETKLLQAVLELDQTLMAGNTEECKKICKAALVILKERNRLCKLNK